MARPINADVPASPSGKGTKTSLPQKPPHAKPPKRRRKPIPGALKAIAGLFALAIVFIVAAILGGDGGSGGEGSATPAPVSEAPSTPAGAPAAETPDELGYPTFATANTTRVGGSDPSSNAAGVALATYPSTAPSQRPDTVTVIDADDWRGAIAASVLMASPLKAPILISEADEVPEPTTQALAQLDPPGSTTTNGVQAFAIGAAAVPSSLETKRIAATGTAGAAAIAALRDELLGGRPEHIVVASAAQSSFAMPAASWAARSGDPVLFAAENALPVPTAEALKRHPHTPVYVLGPSSIISSEVVRQIDKIAGSVHRVSGEDPAANAIALARYARGTFGWNVNDPGHGFVIAPADQPLAAAAAAPLSASGTWGPLLLTESADSLPPALRGYLLDVKPGYTTNPTRAFYNHVWLIGDEETIDVNQQAEIDELAELAKIGGKE